jgi:hypothetical protein
MITTTHWIGQLVTTEKIASPSRRLHCGVWIRSWPPKSIEKASRDCGSSDQKLSMEANHRTSQSNQLVLYACRIIALTTKISDRRRE